jgi:PAS domain S-box-containing protein
MIEPSQSAQHELSWRRVLPRAVLYWLELLALPVVLSVVVLWQVPQLAREHPVLLYGVDAVVALLLGVTAWLLARSRHERNLAQARQTHNLQYLQHLTDNIPVGLCRTSLEDRFLLVNPAMVAMYGFEDARSMCAEAVSSMYADRAQRDRLVQQLRQDGLVRNGLFRMVRRDGETIWVSISARAVRDAGGALEYFDCIHNDVTAVHRAEQARQDEHRQLEMTRQMLLQKVSILRDRQQTLQATQAELAELNATLEQRVEQRTAEVNRLLSQKQRFIHQLGHDLKTPLTPLVAMLPLLARAVCEPRLKKQVRVMQENVGYMQGLVDKTLDLARLNSPAFRLSCQAVDLAEMFETVRLIFGPMFERKEIVLRCEPAESLAACADAIHLREVLHNLLSNARRHVSPGGQVTMSVQPIGQEVQVIVADSGEGLTAEQCREVFQEFHKVDPSRHDRRSVGLGLSICKRIVEAHGGAIWMESDGPGRGARACFTLPRWREPASSEAGLASRAVAG